MYITENFVTRLSSNIPKPFFGFFISHRKFYQCATEKLIKNVDILKPIGQIRTNRHSTLLIQYILSVKYLKFLGMVDLKTRDLATPVLYSMVL